MTKYQWIGPEKGVTQLALGAVVNAIWDLWAKVVGKPVWQLVADMTPQELVSCLDFRFVEDVITADEAVVLLERTASQRKAERAADVNASRAVPTYTTSAGWLGYSKDKMRLLLQQAKAQGYRHFKLKVGTDIATDRERLSLARDVIGYGADSVLMVDANQVWSVPQAIQWMQELAEFKPWFIEEPTSPDDILGVRQDF